MIHIYIHIYIHMYMYVVLYVYICMLYVVKLCRVYAACRMHVACMYIYMYKLCCVSHACIYVFYFKINVILIRISDPQRIIHESGSPPASFWRGNGSSNVSLSFKLIIFSSSSSPASVM